MITKTFCQRKPEVGLKKEKISILWLAAGLFNEIVAENPNVFSTVKYLLAGGEALNPITVHKLLKADNPPANFLNGYGPTENTTFTTTYKLPKYWDSNCQVPIGKPISNTQVYILDENLKPVAIGDPGELYIGGAGVARGYLNNSTLTLEKFINNPFDSTQKTKLYKSGDLCKWRSDGNIEYLGRIDRQVKLRGYRIELDEIENFLKQSGYIQDAVVILREDQPNIKHIVAYILDASSENDKTKKLLHDYLQARLPAYMLPSAYVFLKRLPLNFNNKVDVKVFPIPDKGAYNVDAAYAVPITEIEKEIAALWTNLLGISHIGINDNFIQLGGQSLLVTRMVVNLQNLFGVSISLTKFFANPTIKLRIPADSISNSC